MSKNTDIAEIFYEMADLLEMQGVEWKPRAYRNAARSIEAADDVEKIYKEGGKKSVLGLPGVGEGIAKKIIEFIETGKIKEFDTLTKKLPGGVHDMMHIMGVGPKKAWRLYKELKIKSVSELEKSARAGRLRKLRGFGPKSEEDILKGIETLKKGQTRMPLGKAWLLGQEIIARLKKLKGVKRVEPSGSLRRRKETIGDIDVLVISASPEKVMDAFTTMPNVERVLAKGVTKSAVFLREGISADVRVLKPKSFGAALQYFTGNKEHNIACRQLAIKNGWKLNEYGLFKGNNLIAGRTEEEIYKKLGLRLMPPELRENMGEIEAAKANKLPELISYNAIRGDLHTHSGWSDGANTIEEMIQAAIRMGYEYIALTDHSKSEHVAHGMEEKRLLKYIAEVNKLKKKHAGRINVLAGSEVSIMADGSLDYADKYLKQLDWVVASVHSRFKQPGFEMTKRICTALENEHVSALGHPTGRLIGSREPYEVDLGKVFAAAKANRVALEINAFPSRLDLKDVHIKAAVEQGVKLVIDTDAHDANHLKLIEFGIAQARRGWAEAKDVVNTLPWKKFEKYISR
jgi:DNA polymerase (family 10)